MLSTTQKYKLILVLILLLPLHLWAIPQKMHLQGRLTDLNGETLTTPTQVEIQLFQGGQASRADDGVIVYKEKTVITPDSNGLYQHLIGDGAALEGHSLETQDFETTEPLYLQLIVNGSVLLPRLKFSSVSYSFVSGMAESVKDGAITREDLNASAFETAGLGLVPQGGILMFLNSCPAGFSEVTALRNRVPIGTDTGSEINQIPDKPNAPAGQFTHAHGIEHSHSIGNAQNFGDKAHVSSAQDWASFNYPRLVQSVAASGNGDHVHLEGYTHNHQLTSQNTTTSTEALNFPPSLTVMFCQKN